MPDTAIKLDNVSKTYMLHGSQGDQLIEVLGLRKFGFRPKTTPEEFHALKNISLDIKKGQRIGLVGRNGAGKTTLLKLVCGNFAPTQGEIEVKGKIQALMNIGIGFHPDYTGRENVKASLMYNGLEAAGYEEAVEDIIDFCELGAFFDQPFKTYSLGMQSRLMFATATCIRPEILIVDEVMGAGDAYFVAKSKFRIQNLVNSGCTMLLVSHSMQQVLELCEKAIWLDNGEIIMSGDAEEVVKAYEEYMHGPIHQLENMSHAQLKKPEKHPFQSLESQDTSLTLQEPYFLPNAQTTNFPEIEADPKNNGFDFVSRTGLSRWGEASGLQLVSFTMGNEQGKTNKLTTFQPAQIIFELKALQAGDYNCRYAVAVYDELGNCVMDILSGKDSFSINEGEVRSCHVVFNPLQLGAGDFTLSLSAHDYDSLAKFNSSKRYDLYSRSFSFSVVLPDSFLPIEAKYYHSAEWRFMNK